MTREELEQLLRDADADDAAPRLDANLAERVRSRAKRQRRVRMVSGGGVVAGACAIALVTWVMRPPAAPSPVPAIVRASQPDAPDTAKLRAELLALSSEADRRAAAAEARWASEQISRPDAATSAALVASDVAAQVERAAFTMVYQAARMPVSPAATVYRQVSATFPDAPSARIARERLSELETRKDG